MKFFTLQASQVKKEYEPLQLHMNMKDQTEEIPRRSKGTTLLYILVIFSLLLTTIQGYLFINQQIKVAEEPQHSVEMKMMGNMEAQEFKNTNELKDIDIWKSRFEFKNTNEDRDIWKSRFEQFITEFNKTYSSSAEREYRFKLFIANTVAFEKDQNSVTNDDAHYGVTMFSDWSDVELRGILMPKMTEEAKVNSSITEEEIMSMPELYSEEEEEKQNGDWVVDWRRRPGVVQRVKNQGQCGSCWAFSVCASIESHYAIHKRRSISLSEQQLVDCNGKNHGCRGGNLGLAMRYIQLNGVVRDRDYPYQARETHQCRINSRQEKIKINGYRALPRNHVLQSHFIRRAGPVSFGMNVPREMYHYRGGIFYSDCARHKIVGGHAMTIVGYGSERGRQYWLVKNSWGPNWGERGYMRIAKGYNTCNMEADMITPIV